MKAERLILSFIALLVGLLVAGIGFYFYQITNAKPIQKNKSITIMLSPSPIPQETHFITIDSPTDEAVIDKKSVVINGKTVGDTIVVISTQSGDQVVKASSSGNFSATQTIDTGTNLIYITAFFPDGIEKMIVRTITSSTESF